jgi:hypothetical protein
MLTHLGESACTMVGPLVDAGLTEAKSALQYFFSALDKISTRLEASSSALPKCPEIQCNPMDGLQLDCQVK